MNTQEPQKKKRKRRYVDILKVPLEKLTGWQEVPTDLGKLDASMEMARTRPLAEQYFSRNKE